MNEPQSCSFWEINSTLPDYSQEVLAEYFLGTRGKLLQEIGKVSNEFSSYEPHKKVEFHSVRQKIEN